MYNTYFVYILRNDSRTLYVGVTSDLSRRITQDFVAASPSFTERYHVWKLAYAESFADVHAAIDRDKQIKRWRRDKKMALILALNPKFEEIALY